MIIRTMKISDLQLAPYNPRKDLKPGDREYEDIKRSICEFGYVDPIIWNERSGNIVSGNQRLKVLRDLDVEEAEVSVVDLTMEQEKLLNLAMNKIKGSLDYKILNQLVIEIKNMEADVTLTGLADYELDALSIVKFDEVKEIKKRCPKCGSENIKNIQ